LQKGLINFDDLDLTLPLITDLKGIYSTCFRQAGFIPATTATYSTAYFSNNDQFVEDGVSTGSFVGIGNTVAKAFQIARPDDTGVGLINDYSGVGSILTGYIKKAGVTPYNPLERPWYLAANAFASTTGIHGQALITYIDASTQLPIATVTACVRTDGPDPTTVGQVSDSGTGVCSGVAAIDFKFPNSTATRSVTCGTTSIGLLVRNLLTFPDSSALENYDASTSGNTLAFEIMNVFTVKPLTIFGIPVGGQDLSWVRDAFTTAVSNTPPSTDVNLILDVEQDASNTYSAYCQFIGDAFFNSFHYCHLKKIKVGF